MNKLTKAQNTKLNNFETTSAKIRFLHNLKYTRSEIKNTLNIRYQHVRNVLITPITKPKES